METDFKGAPVPVVTPRMLHRMKRDTVRPKDRGDAEELRRRFGFGERDGCPSTGSEPSRR